MTTSHDVTTKLKTLFDAERTVRRLHGELIHEKGRDDGSALVTALKSEVASSLALPEKEAGEAALRLTRIAVLLGELHGPAAVDTLIDILACDEPEARHAAGEALQDVAFDRFKEVALGIERALERLPVGSPALSELPYMLAEVPEPGAMKLLGLFLKHRDPEAVAAAIEALVEVGDPSATTMLAPLEKDARQVQLDEEDGAEAPVAIGDLATEARQLLAELAAKADR